MTKDDFDRLDGDMRLRASIQALRAYYRALPETDKNQIAATTAIAQEIVAAGYGPIPLSAKAPAGAGEFRLFLGTKGGTAPLPQGMCEELLAKLGKQHLGEGATAL